MIRTDSFVIRSAAGIVMLAGGMQAASAIDLTVDGCEITGVTEGANNSIVLSVANCGTTTDPEPTDPEPTDPEPTDPAPTDPEPTPGDYPVLDWEERYGASPGTGAPRIQMGAGDVVTYEFRASGDPHAGGLNGAGVGGLADLDVTITSQPGDFSILSNPFNRCGTSRTVEFSLKYDQGGVSGDSWRCMLEQDGLYYLNFRCPDGGCDFWLGHK